jgi:hypothetical protein
VVAAAVGEAEGEVVLARAEEVADSRRRLDVLPVRRPGRVRQQRGPVRRRPLRDPAHRQAALAPALPQRALVRQQARLARGQVALHRALASRADSARDQAVRMLPLALAPRLAS